MKELIASLMKAAQLEAELTKTKIDQNLIAQLKMWGAGIFRLVVIGEIKKGKSSFINAMLGVENLVPVSSNVATSTIFKIHYGKERGYRVHFLASSGKERMDINEHDLANFGTEDGNPGNEKQVDFIEVICPAPLLRSGIVIIDTPGLGGLFKNHGTITDQYISRADAVFFISDSVESPIGALEIKFLKKILDKTPYLYFVQTKTGAVDEEACVARKKNNLAILSRELNLPANKIPYFLLDARLRFSADTRKDINRLNRSGYPQLMAFINDVLQPNQQKLLIARALLMMQPTLHHIQEMLSEQKKLLQADSAEKLQQYKQEVETSQNELHDWQKNTLPGLKKRINKGLQEIRLSSSEKCNQLRPGGEIQQRFEKMVQEATDTDGIMEKIEEWNAKLPEFISQTIQEILQFIQTKASILLSSNLDDNSDSSSSTEIDHIRNEATVPMNIRQMRIVEMRTTFDKARSIVMGGTSLMMMPAYLLGGISVVGTPLGILFALFGGFFSYKADKRRDLESARNQATGQLSQCFSSIYADLQQIIQRELTNIQDEVTERLGQYERTRQNELEGRMKEIKDRATMGATEKKEKEKKLQQALFIFDGIKREISVQHKMLETSPLAS